ncbi:hypothetical protein UFOVP1233_44 [uncultured Caudovirales phage]|uniref:Uncharacterized protein n=1 Tax=uncultured Caudovirales phage TaxID=2100421 RepID=A0A6J5RG08_9CAUD|nr:hypothetical protein UFOVP1233_44 [uncultured Caudovirales phage]
MSVILGRHVGAAYCQLGDPALTYPDYPGQYARATGQGFFGSSSAYFTTYPSTTPDELVSLIRYKGGYANGLSGQVYVGSTGGQYNGTVETGSPPSPIGGSPFYQDDRTGTASAYTGIVRPRWYTETAFDLQAQAATTGFTPQGIPPGCQFNYAAPGVAGATTNFSVSYETGYCPHDPTMGGGSTYNYDAEFSLIVNLDEVCCWNEGAEIDLEVDIGQTDFTTTYVSGVYGVHDITLGSHSLHSTLSHTLTIDPTMEGTFTVPYIFAIPKASGYFTYVNDVRIVAVRAP